MSINALWLPGWDHASTWGIEETTNSFYAQLTRNGHSDDNGPEIWITPPSNIVNSEDQLARLISERTGTQLDSVQVAMHSPNLLKQRDGSVV